MSNPTPEASSPPRTTLKSRLLALLLGTGVGLVGIEGALQWGFPQFRGMVSGAVDSPNAALYGWGFPPNYEHRWRDFDSGAELRVSMNDRGFKDRARTVARTPGVARIVIVGDSVTFGLVELAFQYNLVLESLLAAAGCPTEVIALAYGGWATDQELVALQQEGLRYRPDVVIVQFSSNDLEGNTLARDNAGTYSGIERHKPFRFVLSNSALQRIDSPTPPPSWRERLVRPLRSLVSYRLLVTAKELLRARLSRIGRAEGAAQTPPAGPDVIFQRDEARWQLYTALLLALRDLATAQGALFAVFPADPEAGLLAFHRLHGQLRPDPAVGWVTPNGEQGDYFFVAQELTRLTMAHAIPKVTVKRPYTRFAQDFHPNREGNRHMAEDLFDFLTQTPAFAARLCPNHVANLPVPSLQPQ